MSLVPPQTTVPDLVKHAIMGRSRKEIGVAATPRAPGKRDRPLPPIAPSEDA